MRASPVETAVSSNESTRRMGGVAAKKSKHQRVSFFGGVDPAGGGRVEGGPIASATTILGKQRLRESPEGSVKDEPSRLPVVSDEPRRIHSARDITLVNTDDEEVEPSVRVRVEKDFLVSGSSSSTRGGSRRVGFGPRPMPF
ncbi:hypothetical protein HDU98_009427 [Podochytrium sp. JEL0797]|nr:hypothetical protein HDU98_009427 [Podochytrium sp. JEL0797]